MQHRLPERMVLGGPVGMGNDHLAEKTVKNYVSTLLAKLGMQRRTQAAVYGSTLHRSR